MDVFKKKMFLMSLVVGAAALIFVNICRLYDSQWKLLPLKDISTAFLIMLCIAFVSIFGILGLKKIQTNWILSLSNMSLVVLSAALNQYVDSIAAILITLLNLVLFGLNLRFSILNKGTKTYPPRRIAIQSLNKPF